MPGPDWIPGVSQLKSAFQLVTGDVEGALKTQENFLKESPGFSQATSVVQLIAGDPDGALETQKRCLNTVNNAANGIPVVGHFKGAVHHILGDHEGGNQALNAATRSAIVTVISTAAGVATGGIAAIPVAISVGAGYDITASHITGEPQGFVAAVEKASTTLSPGAVFDTVAYVYDFNNP